MTRPATTETPEKTDDQRAAVPTQRGGRRKPPLSANKKSERRLGWLLCAPAALVMILVTAYPIIYSVWLSLQRYDLRFPELYRSYAQQGVDLILVPSAFTHTTGQAHWEVLLRARAIENLAFVAAAAQGGVHPNGRHTWGQSLLIDPWGQVLAERAQEAGVVCAELSADTLAQRRAQLPALQHRVL